MSRVSNAAWLFQRHSKYRYKCYAKLTYCPRTSLHKFNLVITKVLIVFSASKDQPLTCVVFGILLISYGQDTKNSTKIRSNYLMKTANVLVKASWTWICSDDLDFCSFVCLRFLLQILRSERSYGGLVEGAHLFSVMTEKKFSVLLTAGTSGAHTRADWRRILINL